MTGLRETLPLGLDRFLAELRIRGLTVGLLEVERLRQVFRLAPSLDLAGLEMLLESVLVKRPEDRAVFARVFAEWTDRTAGSLQHFGAHPLDSFARSTWTASDREHSKRSGVGDPFDGLDRLAAKRRPQRRRGLRAFARIGALLLLLLPSGLENGTAPAMVPISVLIPGGAGNAEPCPAGLETECPDAAPAQLADLEPAPAPTPEQDPNPAPIHSEPAEQTPDGSKPQPRRQTPDLSSGDITGAPVEVESIIVQDVLEGTSVFEQSETQEEPGTDAAEPPAPTAAAVEPIQPCGPEPIEELPTAPVPTYYTWVAETIVVDQPPRLIALFGLCALLAPVLLWRRYRRHRPPPAPPPLRADGPEWLPLLATPAHGPELVDRDNLQRLVWGIERYLAEELSSQLDLDRTVEDTARAGGLVTLHRAPESHIREVWIWQDEAVEDPVVERLGRELEQTLLRAGLPAQRGFFADVPELLNWEQGQTFSVSVLEGHRQTALVTILTDGYGLVIAHRSDGRHGGLRQLLAGLAQWPGLVFVDISGGRHGLAGVLARYGIRTIDPSRLPTFLGTGRALSAPRRAPPRVLSGDLLAWAAATAIPTDSIDENTAYALRRALGLDTDPNNLSYLVEVGGAQRLGDRLAWNPRRRVELLNWLARAERFEPSRSDQGLLGGIVRFWSRWYQRQIDRRLRHARIGGMLPWRDTRPERDLLMEQALVTLWTDPVSATSALYRLSKGGLRDAVTARLQGYAPADYFAHAGEVERTRKVFLPWSYSDQPDLTRSMLADLGFGGDLLRNPGKPGMNALLAMVIAGCIAAGLSALYVAVERVLSPSLPSDYLHTKPVFAQQRFREQVLNPVPQPAGLGEVRIVLGTPKQPVVMKLGANARIELSYSWQPRENGGINGQSRLWQAGYVAQPIRACDRGGATVAPDDPGAASPWFRRSLVVIQAPRDDPAALGLTARLLDLGGVDSVLLGPDSLRQAEDAFGEDLSRLSARDQLLLILTDAAETSRRNGTLITEYRPPSVLADIKAALPDDIGFAAILTRRFDELRLALDYPGSRPLDDVWLGLYAPILGSGSGILLRGGPRHRDGPLPGMSLVQVCPGTFLMGGGDNDPNASDDERPSHPVLSGGFWMASHETTETEYRRAYLPGYIPEHRLADRVPMVGVHFDEARRHCRRLGVLAEAEGLPLRFTLPTEAQWELAARAGSARAWFRTDAPNELGGWARLGPPADAPASGPAAVMSRRPNTLCLYDMHGNAAEMVQDCYDARAYETRIQGGRGLAIDPANLRSDCRKRVIRGGAWGDPPEYARSADRDYAYPWLRIPARGFRCIAIETTPGGRSAP